MTFIELPFPSAKLSGHAKGKWWNSAREQKLRELHGTMPIPLIAEALGTTRAAVRKRITVLGIRKRFDGYTENEIAAIRSTYEGVTSGEEINLDALCEQLGRSKASVCQQARHLGLTHIGRPKKRETKPPRLPKHSTQEERNAAVSKAARERYALGLHPRGMLGKKHTQQVKDRLRQTSVAAAAAMTADQRSERATKMMRTKLVRYGRVASIGDGRGSWKAGWREIADKRHYFRSRWEANYARYLQWLKARGDILDWEYEPETYWFEAIKRGVRSYLPDFRVHELNGAKILHEVKGWMDARSKTTLKRMAKYHPEVKIILIREKDYKALSRFSALIDGWE